MRRLLILSVLLLCTSCDWGEESELPTQQIEVDGVVREYRLYAPNDEAALPVLFAFHGADGREWAFPQEAEFNGLAKKEGFIIVYPLSKHLSKNEGEWQLNTTVETHQDLDFVEALLEHVASKHDVDRTRVYATGYSLGSMFTFELACQMDEHFVAFSSFAGTMPISPDSCPSDGIPVRHIHGDDDGIIAYWHSWDWKDWDSVGRMHSIPDLVGFWIEKADCQSHLISGGSDFVHQVNDDCAGDVRVEHFLLKGQGHDWPDSIGGEKTPVVIWDFVSDFARAEN